jgi:hypothetical protein
MVVERLKAGVGEWKVIEELIGKAKLSRPEAEAYLQRLGPPVYRHLCASFRTHMMIGVAVWLLAIGLLVAFYQRGVLFVAIGAILGGMADFSYGLFGWRRCRALLEAKTVR